MARDCQMETLSYHPQTRATYHPKILVLTAPRMGHTETGVDIWDSRRTSRSKQRLEQDLQFLRCEESEGKDQRPRRGS